jgi:GNAT superfamily N-acetyltransferase
MARRLSSGEREYATLRAQLRAVEEDVDASRDVARRAVAPHLDLHRHPHAQPPAGERVPIAGGAVVVIRPIEPSDRPELAAGFQHLSALSRFRTLREPARSLTPQQLAELTSADDSSHEALVALDEATGEAVGVGRYVRDRRDPARAELACTVADAWQRRGVGTALIERLAARARASGIEQFLARIIVGDEAGRRLLAHVADEIGESRDGGVVEISGRPRR